MRPLPMGTGAMLGVAPAPEYTFLIYASPVGNYFKEGLAPLNLLIEDDYVRASRGGPGGVKAISNYTPGDVISTPATNGTILPGITRKSIIDIARDSGYKVEECDIPVEELVGADEVFCTGTAVVVAPVGSITYKDKRPAKFKLTELNSKWGAQSVFQKLYTALVGIQMGLIEDKKGWTIEIN
ncbi:hypothetical protein Tsubulata_026212 [Turnera subulata]|uniref:Branched-chain-amino-acid aminotransferase n=1 Tax=Turnera subulata TaxID=218843 RepID=A0A9Q0F8F7_9ROSI|nr:hypothetical protein Tsubulata_026212 [Turnera subulata]